MKPKGYPIKTKDFLITFATEQEAASTINALDAVYEEGLYHFRKGSILITGIGALASALSLVPYCPFYQEIWNIGIAGSLRGLEGLFEIGEVHKFTYMPETTSDHSRNFFTPPPVIIGDGKKLITSDFPLHDETLQIATDLVDMEGYGLALVCQKMRKKLKIWKIVSDFARPGGEKQIREKIDDLSTHMALFIERNL